MKSCKGEWLDSAWLSAFREGGVSYRAKEDG